jgi:hypothetical protein
MNRNAQCSYKEMSVYFLYQDLNKVKIGMTVDLPQRISTIQACNPNELILLYELKTWDKVNASTTESQFHNFFKNNHIRGEWFQLSKNDIFEFINQYVIPCIIPNLNENKRKDQKFNNDLFTKLTNVTPWKNNYNKSLKIIQSAYNCTGVHPVVRN